MHGVIVTDAEGRVVALNQTAQDLLAEANLSLCRGQKLGRQSLGTEVVSAVMSTLETGTAHRQLVTPVNGCNNALMWDINAMQLEGNATGAIIVVEGALQKTVAQRKLQNWERLIAAGEIAAGLAHEIRNPLATAHATIQLFDLVHDDLKRDELLARLRNELDQMNEVLTNYLKLARPQRQPTLRPVHLEEIIGELLFLLENQTRRHSIELVTEIPRAMPPVVGDEQSLKQVFLNVVKNAIEAMSEGGHLQVVVGYDETNGWVTFEDDGPGIPKEHLENILRPFFTTKLTGTGLGLAVSSSLMEAMRGSLRVESKTGRGTTVSVKLPLYVRERK